MPKPAKSRARKNAAAPAPAPRRSPCPVACSLDILGDRWTLLIVRELLIGPARYGELRDGLSAIATNLLTDDDQTKGLPVRGETFGSTAECRARRSNQKF